MLRNFVYNVCGCTGDWKMDSFVENNVKALRERIGDGNGACAPCPAAWIPPFWQLCWLRPSASS